MPTTLLHRDQQEESSSSYSLLSTQESAISSTITIITTTGSSSDDDLVAKKEDLLIEDTRGPILEDSTEENATTGSSTTSTSSSFRSQFFSPKGAPIRIMILICFLAFGYSTTIGVVPQVMTDRYARIYHGYKEQADCSIHRGDELPPACQAGSNDAQNSAAWQSFIQYSFTFVTGSLMGSISDKKGRRGIMCIGAFLNTLAPLCLVLIQICPTMHPAWYYGAGASAGLVSCFATLLACLADVMPPEWRAASFGTMFAAIYFGFALGPQIALLLPSHLAVSIFSAIMMCMAFLTAVFLVPETNNNSSSRATASTTRASPVVDEVCQVEDQQEGRMMAFCNIIQRPFYELSILNRNNLFRLLAILAFFSGMVTSGDETLLVYYAEERLSFNDHDVATMFLITGLLAIVIQSMLIKPFIDCIGERNVLMFSFGVGSIYNTMYGLATTKTIFVGAAAVGTISKMSFPTISAIKANNVSGSEQGRIQGALYSIQALSMGFGPMAMRFVFHLTEDAPYPGPGSMFIFSGGLLLLASGCAYALPADQANSSSSTRYHAYHDTTDADSIVLDSEEAFTTPFLNPLSPVFDDEVELEA